MSINYISHVKAEKKKRQCPMTYWFASVLQTLQTSLLV